MSSLFQEQRDPVGGAVPIRRVSITVNGERRVADVEPRLLLAHFLRQGLRLTGTHTGCDTTKLRGLHRPPRRQTGQVLHGAGGAGRWACRDHRRGPGLGQRAPSAPRGLQGRARSPVRVLHARDDAGGESPPRREPEPVRRGRPLGALGQPLSLHRLPEHREIRALGRGKLQGLSPQAAENGGSAT